MNRPLLQLLRVGAVAAALTVGGWLVLRAQRQANPAAPEEALPPRLVEPATAPVAVETHHPRNDGDPYLSSSKVLLTGELARQLGVVGDDAREADAAPPAPVHLFSSKSLSLDDASVLVPDDVTPIVPPGAPPGRPLEAGAYFDDGSDAPQERVYLGTSKSGLPIERIELADPPPPAPVPPKE
ncbi:MAG: hypothetical protein H6828_12145 [Planctomycetes bacterium]|nr:hypothetical protein [Planctomycetota bacterium]